MQSYSPFFAALLSCIVVGAQCHVVAAETPSSIINCDRLAGSPFDPKRVGDGVEFDRINAATAVLVCSKAVDEDPENARLHYEYGRSLDSAKNYNSALIQYRLSADRGYAPAYNNIGNMYLSGLGVPQNYSEAIKLFRMAADQGLANAQATLGALYENGQGVPLDYTEALKWLRMAADQGYAAAQADLAMMYESGRGVQQDYNEAFKLYKHAAEQNNAAAQNNLGSMYIKGLGVASNYGEAFKWYLKSAKLGNAIAQNNLGANYFNGYGVTKDFKEAEKWYRNSANQGYAEAQNNLAGIFFNGNGVAVDYAEAIKWFRKAAEQGYAVAQSNLGALYEAGIGVGRDRAEAIKWYEKAADQGDQDAKRKLSELTNDKQIINNNKEAQPALKEDNLVISDKIILNSAQKWYDVFKSSGVAGLSSYVENCYRSLDGHSRLIDITPCVSADLMSLSVDSYASKKLGAPRVFNGDVTLRRSHHELSAYIKDLDKRIKFMDNIFDRTQFYVNTMLADHNSLADERATVLPHKDGHTQIEISVRSKNYINTSAQFIDISGVINTAGNITSFDVDGSAAPYLGDGGFSFKRMVPLGSSEIHLVATNEWGGRAETTIHVVRTVPIAAEVVVPPLDPSRLRGSSRPTAIALIIGIEQYKSVPPAEFAENDAKSFYDYATNALGVPASRVKLLIGADAQRVDVEAAILTWLKPQVVKGRSEVFIFFSGHGLASADGRDLYLLPQDGNRALLDRSALRRKEMIDMIVDSGAKSATFFLDTCYSGGTRGKESLVSSARPILVAAKEQAVPPNVTILAASGNDQLSSSLESAKHGLFSYFLMKGLEGAASGGGRTITAAKLESYLVDHVPSEAAKLGRSQMPQLVGDGSEVISAW